MTDLITSKKFLVTLLGMVCITVALIFGAITPQLFTGMFAGLTGIYTVSQGIADHGKEQAFAESSTKIIQDQYAHDRLHGAKVEKPK